MKIILGKRLLIGTISSAFAIILGLTCMENGNLRGFNSQSDSQLKLTSEQVTNSLIKPVFAQNQLIAQSSNISNQLIGTWEMISEGGDKLNPGNLVIFTREGKCFVVAPPPTKGKRTAQQNWYSINSKVQPMQLHLRPLVQFPRELNWLRLEYEQNKNNAKRISIFELTNDGQLRLEFLSISTPDEVPTAFTSNFVTLQKVSNATTLPSNTEVDDFVRQIVIAYNTEGKYALGSVLRGQQSFYFENRRFATTLKQLGISVPQETYRTQIITTKDLSSSIKATSSAKKSGLRSYTGMVYRSKNQLATILCQTNKPSTSPGVPSFNAKGQAQCPPGSSPLR